MSDFSYEVLALRVPEGSDTGSDSEVVEVPISSGLPSLHMAIASVAGHERFQAGMRLDSQFASFRIYGVSSIDGDKWLSAEIEIKGRG